MKILYFDTETTGIDSKLHEIVQIAGIIEINGEIVEEFNFNAQPTNWDNISPEALAVTKKTIDDLKAYPLPGEALSALKAILEKYVDKYDKSDKFYPAGHNVTFDMEFLNAFWKKHGDKYGTGAYQNWRCLDTRILANFMIVHGLINPLTVKLEDLCKIYEIPLDAHDALNDIRATRTLHKSMMVHLSESGKII